MKIRVISPGVLTTVQDGGRFGYQASGMPEAGAMDRASLSLANRLVGNPEDAAVLELTALGGSFAFEGDGTIALTGADMRPLLNEQLVKMDRAIAVKSGDRLDLGQAVRGMRTYLTASGSIDVPAVLGSCSTDLKSGLGGFQGRRLRAGDVLNTGAQRPVQNGTPDFSQEIASERPEPVLERLARVTDQDGAATVRFLWGPQDAMFGPDAKRTFTESLYTIGAASDRMGYRLEGPAVRAEEGTDIISEGICFGSVQVPANGQPIVMMADHQTTGGYAKIATVLYEDLPLLAQLGPGKKIRFCPMEPQ